MKKVLSLKRTQQSAPSKNQKPITQFFKTNVSSTEKFQKSPQNDPPSEEKFVKSKSRKRTAVSPAEVGPVKVNDICKTSSSSRNGYHTPKKAKSDCSPSKEKLSKGINRSPQKECSFKIKVSPKKNVILSLRDDVKENEFVSKDDSTQKNNRSPLIPVDNCIVIENFEIDTGHNNEIIKSTNYVTNKWSGTPKKILQFENRETTQNLKIGDKTPKKNRVYEISCSPKPAKLVVPEDVHGDELSPSKCGSTVKTLDFSQNGMEEVFCHDWLIGDMEEECKEDLDLSVMQRCEVVYVTRHSTRLELRLKNISNSEATCFVEGFWLDTPLAQGDIVSILATRDASGSFLISNMSGLLALRPDHLMSSTSVVSGVFCKRKAVLQERWRGIDSANVAMTMGTLIHELVQKALIHKIMDITKLRLESEKIIKNSIQTLYDAGLSEEEARSNMQIYIPSLTDFMQGYIGQSPVSGKTQKDQWNGHIDKVLDIEENVCCPQLGLKGKIDATLQVTIHKNKEKGSGREKAVVPLELKSGKASVSAEHRGQLVLYGMMLSLQLNEDPMRSLQSGLLLYLKDRVDLREVSCGYPERRDLMMLRNQLVQYLAAGPQDIDPEQITDIEDASCLLQQNLPEPVHHETACTKCPYLTICSLHLWHTNGPSVSETHPLSKLRDQALNHLTPDHVKYFLHWTALLKMEERGQMAASPLHALWTDSVEKRSKRGSCALNLKLKTVQPSDDKHLHVFVRQYKAIETLKDNVSNRSRGPQEGEFSIVSVEARPWIAAGVITVSNEKEINILLERDLSRRFNKDTVFHIDTYESYATTVQNLTNLGVLLEDSDRALRLRRLIIDKVRPEFEKKLPREVGRLGTKLMRGLNIQQQRAVLKAVSAKDYALLQGLPGTGKTQTISVLIEMLVGLKQRVLVTAHTHSAVDTVLSRLPVSVKVMRLGAISRVSSSLHDRCEQRLTAACQTVEQLEQLYNSMEVVGVTCLGATHPMMSRTVFDICIVDEATQVLQCTVLRPLFAAKRFILVGDPEQLPPVVKSRAARRLGMEESLFHRIMSSEATSTLQLQYRMNQPLADIANSVAYSSRLKCADEKVARAPLEIDLKKLSRSCKADWLLTACSPEPEYAAVFLDIEHLNTKDNFKNCSNIDEGYVVLALIDALIEGGVKSSEIGVIAPYRDQVSLLRRAVSSRGAEASTVDQFQGRDKSVIIYSCTKRETQDTKVKDGEILNDQRRLAVSVTRAKHKLLIVGNSRALQRYTPLQRLITASKHMNIDNDVITNLGNKYKSEFIF